MSSTARPLHGNENRGHELVAVTWLFTALATVAVCLKIFTRVKIIKEPALDDFFTVLSLVSICLLGWLYYFFTKSTDLLLTQFTDSHPYMHVSNNCEC